MQIKSAEFITSIVDDRDLLHDNRQQIAFIGRSNVGKSSLMNMLMERRDLVKSSGTPGKTKTVNFFMVNKEFYLVDLPGYGYAKVSKTEREKLKEMIVWYLSETPDDNRKVVMLIDAKAGITDLDIQMIEFLQDENIEFILAANKIDKLNQKETHQLRGNLESLLPNGQKIVYVSALKKKGRDKFWESVAL